MITIFTSFLTAFLITYFLIPSVIRVASIRNLFDEPDERKQHQHKIPALGGVALFTGILFSVLIGVDALPADFLRYFILAVVLIFLVGLRDDMVALSPVLKLWGELGASGLVVYFGNIRLFNLHGLLGIYELPYLFSFLLTMLVFIIIINAFNLIDGLDGLAGGIGLIGATAFGSIFWYSNQLAWAAVAFAIAGALLAFLKFNFSPARIFMGDGGSLLIGFLLAVMCVKFLDTPILLNENQKLYLPAPVVALAILIVPLADLLRVFIFRILHRKSPFQADRNHVHHLLLKLRLSHQAAAITLYLANIFFILIILTLTHLSLNFLFMVVVLNGFLLINIPQILLQLNKQEIKEGRVLNV